MKIRVAHSLTRLAGGPAYRTDIVLRYLDPDRFDTRLYYGSTSAWDPSSHDEIVRCAPYPCVHIPSMQREIRPLRAAVGGRTTLQRNGARYVLTAGHARGVRRDRA